MMGEVIKYPLQQIMLFWGIHKDQVSRAGFQPAVKNNGQLEFPEYPG